MSVQECPLSGRELEILALVATGVTNAQIARDLRISPNTVKVHLRNIFAKLEVESRTEATTLAIREGWIRIGETIGAEPVPEGGSGVDILLAQPRRHWEALPLWQRMVFAALLCGILLAALWPVTRPGGSSRVDAFADHASSSTGNVPRSGVSRWTEGAQMPTPRARLGFVSLDGLLYAIGGDSALGISDLVEVYDPASDLWSRRASKPTAVANVGVVAWRGSLYVPGGYTAAGDASDALEIYDPGRDSWSSGPSLPEPLFGYALALVEDSLVVFGGSNGTSYRDVTYIYDLVAQKWSAGTGSGVPRAFSAAAEATGLVYVVGGYDGDSELDLCQRYDLRQDRNGEAPWFVCAPMLAKRAGLGATVAAGQLYVIGGGWQSHLYFNERYDPRTDLWASVETPIVGQWRTLGVAALEQAGESVIYAAGGWNGGYLAVTERFRPLFYVNLPIIP